MKPGWFLIGFLLGASFGAGGAVVFLEWAVRKHYERANAAEIRAWEAEHKLAAERAWAPKKRDR
jgi:hypothetical protein